MLNDDVRYQVIFPDEYQGQWEEECAFKGWLSGALVRRGDGREYSVTFVDIQRLSQMLDDQIASGYSCYAEPGLVVVAEVTRINMEAAVRELIKENFFDSLRARE
jgi:hypothetical protein